VPAIAPAAIELRGLSRRFGSITAVRDVSLDIAPGEIICLLGSSGCGKSTLLRLIAGLETPDAGSVRMDGTLLNGPGTFVPPERRGIGLVFQDYALFPHLSVLDNVAFGLTGPRVARSAAATSALARVRLDTRTASFPHMLSGGEQQRVALARALAPAPRLLLMDEPFSNLDRGLRDRVRGETLAILRDAGITAVIVTHDPEEALRIADRIVLLQSGAIEQMAPPEELYCRPASLYAARFFSELIELPGRITDGRIVTPLGSFSATGLADGTAARVALRPHAVHPVSTGGTPARVLERTFTGAGQQLTLSVDGMEHPLVLQVYSSCHAKPGDTLAFAADPDAAMIFPESTPSPRSPP
jgi:iron(III) transport system ATP-binding protein